MGKLLLSSFDQIIKRLELFEKTITNADKNTPFFSFDSMSQRLSKL